MSLQKQDKARERERESVCVIKEDRARDSDGERVKGRDSECEGERVR